MSSKYKEQVTYDEPIKEVKEEPRYVWAGDRVFILLIGILMTIIGGVSFTAMLVGWTQLYTIISSGLIIITLLSGLILIFGAITDIFI